MKKVFMIYCFDNKEIHVPSDDYYSKKGDSAVDDITFLRPLTFEEFDSEIEAEQNLVDYITRYVSNVSSYYLILPTYQKATK